MSARPQPKLVRSREFWAKLRRRQAERAALDSIFTTGGFNAQSIVTFVPGSITPTHSVMLLSGKVLPISSQPESSSIECSTHAARPQPRPKPRRPLTRSGKTWEQEDGEMLARLKASRAKREAKENAAAKRKATQRSRLSQTARSAADGAEAISIYSSTTVGASPTEDEMSSAAEGKGEMSAGPHPQPDVLSETAAVVMPSRPHLPRSQADALPEGVTVSAATPHPPVVQADILPETAAMSAASSGSSHAEEEEAGRKWFSRGGVCRQTETHAN
ncbi:hypothetical protein B0H16DRAFT_1464450 [Mycena metata]|uniref:Uncharacterized protein n=1 Tax=Mycena metata TaxID=1033252 RepID=A0AAD7N283_9AGAR|nr:hypothetical protein B0H16DRAFT_1464450 [Mycena metata]